MSSLHSWAVQNGYPVAVHDPDQVRSLISALESERRESLQFPKETEIRGIGLYHSGNAGLTSIRNVRP